MGSLAVVLFALVCCSTVVSTSWDTSIVGKQIVREVYPNHLHSNIQFGAGYNSITFHRTGTAAVNIPTVSPRSSKTSSFVRHTFQIKHFANRDELKTEYGQDSDITVSEGYMGSSSSDFVKVLMADDVSLMDSVLAVDVDIISDTESVKGSVELVADAKRLLNDSDFYKFVELYGTHYLRSKIYGGKLIMLLKIRSKNDMDKQEIDKKLKQAAGYIGQHSQFKQKILGITKLGRYDLDLYTLGGSKYTGSLQDLDSVLDYVLSYSSTVHDSDDVRTLEFNALWNLVHVPREFKQFVFSHQKDSDKIMRIFGDLKEVATTISDIDILKNQDLDWISAEAHGKILGIEICLDRCVSKLTRKFTGSSASDIDDVYEEFRNASSDLEAEVLKILKEEMRYESLQETYLVNPNHMSYISYQNWEGYTTANAHAKLVVYLENVTPQPKIRYRTSQVYIKSHMYPGQVMCLGRHYWGVFWRDQSSAYTTYCTWTLKHSTDFRKDTLEYGDQFMLNNVNWPSYAMGLDNDDQWIMAVMENDLVSDRIVWQMKKL